MGFVAVLRELWRFRMSVLTAAVFALAVAVLLMFRVSIPGGIESRQYQVGIASTTALVDTPSSQVVDLGDTGSDVGSLSARASLLASLMTSSPIKDEIARRAGVAPDALIAIPPSSDAAGAAPAQSGVVAGDRQAVVLKAKVPALESGEVPIIAVETQAPDARRAATLADEAISVLQSHLESVAATGKVPADRRIVVRQLGPARAGVIRRGPGPLLAIVGAIAVLGLSCGGLLGISWLVRVWRGGPDGPDGADTDAGPREPAFFDWEDMGDESHEDVRLVDVAARSHS
jgi:hypothetical protein